MKESWNMVGIKLWRGFLGFAKESVLNWVKKAEGFWRKKKKKTWSEGLIWQQLGKQSRSRNKLEDYDNSSRERKWGPYHSPGNTAEEERIEWLDLGRWLERFRQLSGLVERQESDKDTRKCDIKTHTHTHTHTQSWKSQYNPREREICFLSLQL